MNRDQFSDEQAAELEALGYNEWAFFGNLWYNNIHNAFDYLREVYHININITSSIELYPLEYKAVINSNDIPNNNKAITIWHEDIYELRLIALDKAIAWAEEINNNNQ